MPDWLTEGNSTVLFALGFLVIVLGVLAVRTRQRRFVVAAGVLAVAVVLMLLIDHAVVSPYEQAVMRVQRIAERSGRRQFDTAFADFAADFHYRSFDKPGFQAFCAAVSQRGNVTAVDVWGFEKVSVEPGQCVIDFQFKVHGNWSAGNEFFRCRATFHPEADGQWRMATFEIYNPLVESKTPMEIPGLR